MSKIEDKYFKVDKDFAYTRKNLVKLEEKIGWKSLFFEFINYQRHFHSDSGYNFDKTRKDL